MYLAFLGQKTSARSTMKKQIEDVFSKKLLSAVDKMKDEVVSADEMDQTKGQVKYKLLKHVILLTIMIYFKFLQVLSVSLHLSGYLARVLQILVSGESSLPTWEMPKSWTSVIYKPLEFEEYLRDKWRADLAPVVLQVSQEYLSWWGVKKTATNLAKNGRLCRVQSYPWKPVQEQFLPGFLIFEKPISLLQILDEVNVKLIFK